MDRWSFQWYRQMSSPEFRFSVPGEPWSDQHSELILFFVYTQPAPRVASAFPPSGTTARLGSPVRWFKIHSTVRGCVRQNAGLAAPRNSVGGGCVLIELFRVICRI